MSRRQKELARPSEEPKVAARELKAPAERLAGHSPLQHSRTESGAVEVEQLIGRIEHAVPT